MNDIRFDDGAAYERYMGVWSRLAGDSFLGWLAPPRNAHWLDVGCGNGAFTGMIVDRCAPASVHGIDPSEEQLAYARARFSPDIAEFRRGDAMALPYDNDAFDEAVMPLVIFFVPDPAKGVGEMTRVVRAGGMVSAYAWDMHGGGFPYHALQSELRGMGAEVPAPASPGASRMESMRELWSSAGLEAVETTEITVQRTFASFGDYWETILGGPSVVRTIGALSESDLATLQQRMRAQLAPDADGRITYEARANAIKGRVTMQVVGGAD